MVRNSSFKVCFCKVELLTENGRTDEGLNQVWRLVLHPKSISSTLKNMRIWNPMSWHAKSMEWESAFTRSTKVTFMQYALLKCSFLNQCPGSWLSATTYHAQLQCRKKKFSLTKTDNYIDKGSPLMKRKKKSLLFPGRETEKRDLGISISYG